MAKDCKQEILALREKVDAYEALAELKYCGSCSHFKEKVNEFGDYICCCIRSIYGMPFTKEDSCSYWEEKELEQRSNLLIEFPCARRQEENRVGGEGNLILRPL